MPGSVRVSVLEVVDLPLALVGRTVQVRVTMGMKEYKTKPVRALGGKTPPWNADFAFPVLNLRDKLVVLIVGNRGETMTKAEIEVSTIVQKGYRDEFVPLQGGGRIHLKLSFVLSEEERRRIEAMRVTKKQPPSPPPPRPQQPEPLVEEPAPPVAVAVPVPPPVTLPPVPPPPPSLTITEIVDEEDKENEGRGARPGRRVPKGLAWREQGQDGGVAETAGKAAVAAAEGSGKNVEAGEEKEEEGKALDDDDGGIADGEVAAPATPPQQEAAVPEREPEGVGSADGAGEEGEDVNMAEDAAEVENFLEKEMGESWMDEWIRDKSGEEEAKREVVTAELGAGGKAQERAEAGVEVEVEGSAGAGVDVDVAREGGRSEVGAGEGVEEQGTRLEEEKQAAANELAQEARDGLEDSDGDDDSVSFEDRIDAVQRRWLMYADTMAVQQGEAQAKDVGMQDQVKAVDEGKGKAGAVQEHVQEVEESREVADGVPEVRETHEARREGGDSVPEFRETNEARREEAGEVPEFLEAKEGRREEGDQVPEFRGTSDARIGEAETVPAFPETDEATIDAPEFRETNQATIEEADVVVPEFSESKEARAGESEDTYEFRETDQARGEEANDFAPEFPQSKEARAGDSEDASEFRETKQSRVDEADDDASKFSERKEARIGGADDAPEFRETSQARIDEADDALESQETKQAQQVREIPVQILPRGAAAGNGEQEAVEEAFSVPVPVRSDGDTEARGRDSYHDSLTTVDKRVVEETPTVTRGTAEDELRAGTAKSAPPPLAAEPGKQQQEQSSKPASAKGKGEARHPNVGGIIAHFLGGFAIVAGAAAVFWSVGSRKYHVVAEGESFHTFAPPNSSSLQNSAFCKLNPGVCESSKVYSGQRLRLA